MTTTRRRTTSYQPISALNDFLFCERRCALHRNEQVWVENRHTLEGTDGHQRVHADPTREELGSAGRLVRGMWLKTTRLRLVGVADLVEFRTAEGDLSPVVYPVEFKRGRRRRWDNDDVQLCAQALCLEEMLQAVIPAGAIFHLKSRRRREVAFDNRLRSLTEMTAARLHELVASGATPPPVLKTRCRGCSVRDLCMPELLSRPRSFTSYQNTLYHPLSDSSDAPIAP